MALITANRGEYVPLSVDIRLSINKHPESRTITLGLQSGAYNPTHELMAPQPTYGR